MYAHYGEKHDLQTPEGRSREAMEVRFDLYMLPMPTTITEICGSFLVSEHLKQSSSYLNSAFNVAVGRSVLDQLFKNTVPTPVTQVDFDHVEPRKSPGTQESPSKSMNPAVVAIKSSEIDDQNVKTNWEAVIPNGELC